MCTGESESGGTEGAMNSIQETSTGIFEAGTREESTLRDALTRSNMNQVSGVSIGSTDPENDLDDMVQSALEYGGGLDVANGDYTIDNVLNNLKDEIAFEHGQDVADEITTSKFYDMIGRGIVKV